jgi:hypothetical protein
MHSPSLRRAFVSLASASLALIVAVYGCQRAPKETVEKAPSAPSTGYTFAQNYPTPDAATKARDDADFQRAVTAYRFWYPAVSLQAVFEGQAAAGAPDNGIMVVAGGPRHVMFTLNSDTPYGGGAFNLKDRPLVVEMPPGAFIALADDRYQGWIMDMGLPGPDAGKGGKHLIVGPDFKGKIPGDYFVGHSKSNLIMVAIRSIPVDGNVTAASDALRNIKIYPLASASHPDLSPFVDLTDKPISGAAIMWEDNIQYWQRLHDIIDEEPAVPEWSTMYGPLASLGIAKGQPFQPDARMTELLTRAAREGRDQMLVSAFASARGDIKAWTDRRWEWAGLISDKAELMTTPRLDTEARDRWFIQAIVSSPAMFRRSANAGSLYWLGHRDATGAYLDGSKSYKLTVPLPVPAKLFWSVTAYDAATRSEVVTQQDRAALRSLFELKDLQGSSVDLYFGPTAPAGQEAHWIQTEPGKGWFTYFRIYGPDAPAFDGSWKPGDFEEVAK